MRFGIPEQLAVALVEDCNLRVAVETGTYLGTSAQFLHTLCRRTWSVELSPFFHAGAAARYADVLGLEFVLGDSADVLPSLLEDVGEPALFWLDGHAMPGDNTGAHAECPIAAEIAAINASRFGRDACILIDDAVLFQAAPHAFLNPEDWPSLIELFDLLRTPHDRYVTLLDDVIIAGPPRIRPVIDRWWQDVVKERGGTTMVPLMQFDRALNPTPKQAARGLAKALVPGIGRIRRWSQPGIPRRVGRTRPQL